MWPSEAITGNNPSLQQGLRMTQYERSLLEAAGPHLDLLQLSSDPQLMSHVEALGDSDTERSAEAAKLTQASNLEDQFNRTLVEYSKAYKDFSEATLKDIRSRNTGPIATRLSTPEMVTMSMSTIMGSLTDIPPQAGPLRTRLVPLSASA